MKTIIPIIPVLALAISLAACGSDHSSTTSATDSTTTNGSPMGNTATDNTGTGIQGGTTTTDANAGANGGANSSGNTSTTGGASGTNAAGGSSGATTVLQRERTNANRSGASHNQHLSPSDSINNRNGLAPQR